MHTMLLLRHNSTALSMVLEALVREGLVVLGLEMVLVALAMEGLEVLVAMGLVLVLAACRSVHLPQAFSPDNRTTALLPDTLAHQIWCRCYLLIHTLSHSVCKNRQRVNPASTHQIHRESSARKMHRYLHFLFHLLTLFQRQCHGDCTNSYNLRAHLERRYDQCR